MLRSTKLPLTQSRQRSDMTKPIIRRRLVSFRLLNTRYTTHDDGTVAKTRVTNGYQLSLDDSTFA